MKNDSFMPILGHLVEKCQKLKIVIFWRFLDYIFWTPWPKILKQKKLRSILKGLFNDVLKYIFAHLTQNGFNYTWPNLKKSFYT